MSEAPVLPTEFAAHQLPQLTSKPIISFRGKQGEMGISIALFDLLDPLESRRVKFVEYKGDLYITRTDRDGFWLNLSGKPSKNSPHKFCAVNIANKAHTRLFLRSMGYEPDHYLRVNVAKHKVSAVEIKADPALNPYPFFRLMLDKKLQIV